MRWKLGGVILGGLILTALLAFVSTASAQKRAWPVDRLANGARVRAAFAPVVKEFRDSVVRVMKNGNQVALGTVVADGLVLTKASEITTAGSLDCQQGKTVRAARAIAWSEPYDLAVLAVETTDWKPVTLHEGPDPEVGHFVIAASYAELPIAIGIVSVARRAIDKEETHGVLGIQLDNNSDGDTIAVVKQVFEGSAAEAAGIQAGDQIQKVGAVAVASGEELQREIFRHQPGETLAIELNRGESHLTLSATLGHPFGDLLSRIAQQNRLGGEVSRRSGGFPVAIQHDSVLKPEECGGPAVDIEGHVIGLNIARSGRTESLLIPASAVKEVLAAHAAGTLPPLSTPVATAPQPLSPPPAVPTE